MTAWRRSGVGKALALLALAVPLWECGSCWGLSPGPGDLEKSPRSDPGPWEVLHRHRRSWVWNQFFVLEEYTGNEPLYVGKVSETPLLTGSAPQRSRAGHARTYRARVMPDDGFSTNWSYSCGCPAPFGSSAALSADLAAKRREGRAAGGINEKFSRC